MSECSSKGSWKALDLIESDPLIKKAHLFLLGNFGNQHCQQDRATFSKLVLAFNIT